MKQGCLGRLAFGVVLMTIFGASSYFWFQHFVRGSLIQTPALIGSDIAKARAIASDAGLILVVDNTKDRNAEKVPLGAVVWQNRAAGSSIKRGTRIHVGQSLGPLVLSVPDLSGQSARTALLRFGQRNLKLGNLAYMDHPTSQGVIAEDPPRGTVVQGQTAVSLLLAYTQPPPAYVMPDLIDRPLDAVRSIIESVGLTVTTVKFESYPGIRDGIIIRQYPPHGAPVNGRDAITVVVSKQEETTIIEQQESVIGYIRP